MDPVVRHEHWPVVCEHELPSRRASVSMARILVRSALSGFPEDTVETALLLTSELVTNAVRRSEPCIRLRIEAVAGRVLVAVVDFSEGRPQLREPLPEADGGRGLQLVDALSASWGWVPSAAGKRVWFEL